MTTFISYSRVHSEFVVRLARDLKSAGYDVWLDQLDIPKGARWDDAIEAAVDRSSTFMIVLSPESIESQNVKDELSYAIDSGKNILPVVIKPCKIPLRLRRFQYVDFTDKPYKESLADIKKLLNNTRPVAKVPAEDPDYEQPVSTPTLEQTPIQGEPEAPPEPLKETEPINANTLRKLIVPVLLAVIGLGVVVAGLAFAANRNAPPPATFTLNPPTITSTATAFPPPTPVPPSSQIVDNAGVTLRLVSAGDFVMGSDSGMADERPVQSVFLDTFYIDKYEVTNVLYRVCVDSGVCLPPKEPGSKTRATYYDDSGFDNYPVVYVDWDMARAYCEWRGARLPTEAEWEKAARGTDGRTYPWGEDVSCNEANYFGCQDDTDAVTSFGSGLSVYGVYNMAGNVHEWVSSLYLPYPYDPADGREDPDVTGDRVLRGGSWLNSDSDNEVRSARRQTADPSTAAENIGFRCALTAVILDTGATPTTTPANSFVTQPAPTKPPDEKDEEEKSGPTATRTPVSTRTSLSASLTASRTATPRPPATTRSPTVTTEPAPTTMVPPPLDPTTAVPPPPLDPTTAVPPPPPDPTTAVPPPPPDPTTAVPPPDPTEPPTG